MADRQESISSKHIKIQRTQRTMFYWVIGMSIIVGFALVVSWFLVQQFMFRAAVIGEKSATVAQLKKNNEAIKPLGDNIRKLETSEALMSIKPGGDSKAIQVILDALPADDNPLALTSSVQDRLTANIPSLVIDNLSLDARSKSQAGGTIPFTLKVSSTSPNDLKALLVNFERSIRVIDIDHLSFEKSGSQYSMVIAAHGYYEPPVNVALKQKNVPEASK